MDQIKRAVTGPWGIAAGLMTSENIGDIERMFLFQEEPEKARLVLSPLFLRKPVLDDVKGSLAGLKELATRDKGEWVEMISAAVDGYDGRIHTDKVLKKLPQVKASIEEVEALAEGIDPALHRPLVERYLSDEVLLRIGGLQYRKKGTKERPQAHSHFAVRAPALKTRKDHESKAGMPQATSVAPPPPVRESKASVSNDGFGGLATGIRKRPAMPGSTTSMFLKSTKPKTSARGPSAPPPVKKKPVVLDITSIKQVQTVTKKRRADLVKEQEEQKEKEAQERAEERQQRREDLQERKNFMRDSEKRKKEKAREEERLAREEAREAKRKTKAPVDGEEVAEALKAARNKADVESAKDIENIDAYQIEDDSQV